MKIDKNKPLPKYTKVDYWECYAKTVLKELFPDVFDSRAFVTYTGYLDGEKVSVTSTGIGKLNPNLRSIDNFNGQMRVWKFYAMSAVDAYSILEAIAEIRDCTDKLKLIALNEAEKRAELTAEEVKKRSSNFSFSEAQIPVGAVLEFYNDPTIQCTVVDDRRVEYNGEVMYLTSVAKMVLGKTSGIAGPRYFKYKGTMLWDIEGREE